MKKGVLVAGPIQGKATKYGGTGSYGVIAPPKEYNSDDEWQQVAPKQPKGQASAIAEYDFGVDKGTVDKEFELVSHKCATEVAEARTKANLTQTQLASKVNEKPSAIIEVEKGTARYNADLINRIEKVLNVKINRGRTKAKKK